MSHNPVGLQGLLQRYVYLFFFFLNHRIIIVYANKRLALDFVLCQFSSILTVACFWQSYGSNLD
jgi:hypothetical protein